MRFQREVPSALAVRSYRPGELYIGDTAYHRPLILSPRHVVHPWQPGAIGSLHRDELRAALELQPDLILLGTGAVIEFPPPRVRAEIMAQGIGLEVMDTAAACRTFNVLVFEERSVVAALIV